MISDSQMEKAMNYLADTDEEEAKLYFEMEKAEYAWKGTKDAVFLSFGEGSVAEKQAKAATDERSEDALKTFLAAVLAHREVLNKRKRAVLTVEVWRSLNANRRQGQ